MQAQIVSDFGTRGENFEYRIKNIEFFIDRFNGNDPLALLKRPATTDTSGLEAWHRQREGLLLSLFDHARLQRKGYDTQVVTDFIHDVNSRLQQKSIHFSDSLWYAVLQIDALHKSQPVSLWCVLRMCRGDDGAFTWSLQNMYCPALRAVDVYQRRPRFAPNIHGTDFMTVRLALKEARWIRETKAANNSSTPLLDMIQNNEVIVHRVNCITYHFMQCRPWILKVQYINRESRNSGWLIESVAAMSDQDLANYRSKNHLR